MDNNKVVGPLVPLADRKLGLWGHRAQPSLRKLLFAAAFRMRNRGVITATSIAGMALLLAHIPWIGLAVLGGGAATYGALVIRDLFDPRLIRQVYGCNPPLGTSHEENEACFAYPIEFDTSPDDIEPAELREVCRAILLRHGHIRERLLSADPMVRASLADMYRCCTKLVVGAEQFAVRGSLLNEYLSLYCADDLEADIRVLDSYAEDAASDVAKAVYRAAAKCRRRHLETHHEILAMYDRIRAMLNFIKVSLDAVEARLVKLPICALEGIADDASCAALEEHMDALSVELGSLESSVIELLAEAR